MWCYAEQMSHPGVFIPCCLIITPTTIYLEKLIGIDSGFEGVPHLQPLYIVSIKNIQQIVIGPCYCYFRLEESFVGKSGTFSILGLDTQSVRRVVTNVVSLCRKVSPSSDLDCVDLSMHSDLLKQIILHEENLSGSVSDRLVLMIPIRMLDSTNFNFLVLSENRVYCVGLNCTMWPPPSFQSSPDNKYCLDILHEFSILNKIVDLKIYPSGSHCLDDGKPLCSGSNLDSLKFSMYPLSVNVSVSEKDWIANAITTDTQLSKDHKCYTYLFPSSACRDLFLDRLSNLRAEHENQTYPNVREEPEGGNEQVPTAKCQNYSNAGGNDIQQVLSASLSSANHSTPHNLGAALSSQTLTKSNTSDIVLESDSTESAILPKSASIDVTDSVVGSPNHSESNESFRSVLTDSDVYKEAIEYQGPNGNSAFYSSSPKDDLSVSPMSNFSRASISPPPDYQKSKTVNVKPEETVEVPNASDHHQQSEGWRYAQTSAKADSLPSSFDWKKFYFKSPMNRPETVIEHSPQGPSTVVASQTKSDSSGHDESFGNRLFLDLKNAITTSGGSVPPEKEVSVEVDKTLKHVVVESEHDKFLKQCVKSYDLIHTLPTKLKPLCLMNGAELRKFFYATIAQYSNPEGLQEELHFVLWGSVVPYTNPRQEIVTLIMLSTYAAYLVSDTEVKVTKTSRPSWMSHSRNQSDSAIAWKTEGDVPGGPNRKHVKSYAVLKYKDLHQINIGLFDQCVRLTGSNEDSVFTIATRDRQVTENLVQKLKQVLSLSVSSPMIDLKSPDLEQDFYKASRSQTNKSTSEGLVYTHPSKVNFIYPGDEAVRDMLYLMKERIVSSTSAAPQSSNLTSSLWSYMQCYLLPSDDTTNMPVTTTSIQARSIIITPIYFSLAEEDVVTYPLPDFVRGLPENPCHEILECRHIDSLKSIQLYQTNPHWVCLTFVDEKLGIIVDVSMQHFGQPQGGARERQKPGPEVSFKFYIQSLAERDKLVQVLEKLWKQQVSVVGRMLDIHKV